MKRRERELAETLYVESQLTHDEICTRLKVSPRTVRYWDQKHGWSEKREAYVQRNSDSLETIETFIKNMEAEMRADKKARRKTTDSRINAYNGLLKRKLALQNAASRTADKIAEPPPAKKKPPLTPEHFLQIEKETFGLVAVRARLNRAPTKKKRSK